LAEGGGKHGKGNNNHVNKDKKVNMALFSVECVSGKIKAEKKKNVCRSSKSR
jgi:hypothetical protein